MGMIKNERKRERKTDAGREDSTNLVVWERRERGCKSNRNCGKHQEMLRVLNEKFQDSPYSLC